MADRMREYKKGRSDGMSLAYKIVKEKGIAALKDEIRFRGSTGINTRLAMKELEEASTAMRGFLNEGHILMWLSVLHDEFGFGEKRLNRAMDRFESIYASINTGYAGYADYVDEMSKKMGKILSHKFLPVDEHWEKDPEK